MDNAVIPWAQAIEAAKPKFMNMALAVNPNANWEAEISFASQAMRDNDRLATCDPVSIRDALINLGTTGLSLNKATKEAYLVPRKGKCVLDVSYIGLIALATDTGSVDFIRAEKVHRDDVFEYRGPSCKCIHTVQNVFGDRGPVVGFYAEAKLSTNDWLTEIMDMDQINEVRKSSMAKSGPWFSYPEEMGKKTAIKRLCKTLPKSDNSGRLHSAIQIVNEHEGLEEEEPWQPAYTVEEKELFHKTISGGNASEVFALSRTISRQAWIELFGSFPRGRKTEMKELVRKMIASVHETCDAGVAEIQKLLLVDDDAGALEIFSEFTEHERDVIENTLDAESYDALKRYQAEAA